MATIVSGTQSIERTFELLRSIARSGLAGAHLTQLAADLNLPHPTVHRLLRALVAQRAVARNAETKRYYVGPLCFELGLASNYSARIVEPCKPSLERLAQATGDTVYLVMRSGNDAVCLYRMEAGTSISAVSLDVGGWCPLGAGAAGVALLAGLSDDEGRKIVQDNLNMYARHQGLTGRLVVERMIEARKTGIGGMFENITEGVSALGVAVPMSGGKTPILGVSVAAVTRRIVDRRDLIVCALANARTELTAVFQRPSATLWADA